MTEITFPNLCTARVTRLTPHLIIGHRRGDHAGPAFVGNGILSAHRIVSTRPITHVFIGKMIGATWVHVEILSAVNQLAGRLNE